MYINNNALDCVNYIRFIKVKIVTHLGCLVGLLCVFRAEHSIYEQC